MSDARGPQDLITLGQLFWRVGQLDLAEKAWQEALATFVAADLVGTDETARAGGLLFDLYQRQGRLAEAMRAMRDALVLGPRSLWKALIGRTQLGREKLLREHHAQVDQLLSNALRWSESPAAAEVALDLLLWRRGVGVEPYRCANRASRRDPAIEQSLLTLERARAEMTSLLFDAKADTPRPHGTQIVREGVRRSPEVDQLEVEIFAALTEDDCASILRPPDVAAVSSSLPPNAALVEYWRCRESWDANGAVPPRYLALVLRSGDPPRVMLHDLGAADEVDGGLLVNYLGALTSRPADGQLPSGVIGQSGVAEVDDASSRALGAELRALIFDPLLPALQGATQLFIVPDGLLARLSFVALPLGDDAFLIDDYSVSYLQSGRDLVAAPAVDVAAGPSMVVAAPAFGDPPDFSVADVADRAMWFPELSGARLEGEQVAARLGVEPVLDAAATKARVKACRSPRILHLSTHGLLLPVTPVLVEMDPFARPALSVDPSAVDFSGRVRFPEDFGRLTGVEIEDQALRTVLVLAGANTWLYGDPPAGADNGLLNAEDIAQIDLVANELTVLSACETGLGVIETGEGVLGLRSAFHVAGARTLVLSLWSVPDDQTRELMLAFYDEILSGDVGRAEALHRSQRSLRARYPNEPDLWAGFICQGDAGPLLPAGGGPLNS